MYIRKIEDSCCQESFDLWPLGATCALRSHRRRGSRWRSRWWRHWSVGRKASSVGRTPPDPPCPTDLGWPSCRPPSPERTQHTASQIHIVSALYVTTVSLAYAPGCCSCQTLSGCILLGTLRWCGRWGGRSSPLHHLQPPHTLYSAWPPVSSSNLRTHIHTQGWT